MKYQTKMGFLKEDGVYVNINQIVNNLFIKACQDQKKKLFDIYSIKKY